MKAVLLAWLVWLALPLAAQTVFRDDRGAGVTLQAPPQRVVSLLPSLTEMVCALDACDTLVGTDQYSDWPVRVKALPKLGGLDDAQVERIVGLRPDVVLASRSQRLADRLETLGLKVLVLDSDSHSDVRRSLELVSRVLGRGAAGERLWAAIERAIAEAAARVPPVLRGRTVYFEVDSGPYAAGPKSFIGQTLARLGMTNIVPASMGAFPLLNPEFVVRANPDVIIATERELAAMPARPGWQGLAALSARGCGFDGERFEMLVRPGPRLGEAAAALADCLAGLGRR